LGLYLAVLYLAFGAVLHNKVSCQWPAPRARRPPSSALRSSAWDELGCLLGRGTFAKVYYARSLDGGDPVAVKVLVKQQLAATGMATRVLHEVSAMRRLRHPNVLCLYDVLAPELVADGPCPHFASPDLGPGRWRAWPFSPSWPRGRPGNGDEDVRTWSTPGGRSMAGVGRRWWRRSTANPSRAPAKNGFTCST
jgi:hypothetical protein